MSNLFSRGNDKDWYLRFYNPETRRWDTKALGTRDKNEALRLQMDYEKGRFTKSKEGVVFDSHILLNWYTSGQRRMHRLEAESWIASLDVANVGWRMAKSDELATLYSGGIGRFNMDPVFGLETLSPSASFIRAWSDVYDKFYNAFSFKDGTEFASGQECHAFAVQRTDPT